ncbi:hypothetical protein SAMN05444354_13248 [Stigmatella aurantiaca]|uniref:MlpA protein n=1 Tax=Stigmatella aurantiaca TaxID=41 RepID=A0A1H8E9Y2_STIAU|nr:hypothetical protein [Stigmatella aurantiaca]SEN16292.1 hypothetical protein SAMN05444354_13248 [Stigmatella aurantiaca]
MKRRVKELSVGVAAAALLACNTEDPERQCVVARAVSDGSIGSFAAAYTLKEGQDPSRACAQLTAEPVGLQKYYSEDPAAPDTVAIRSARVGKLLEQYASRLAAGPAPTPNSLGALGEVPGEDNFCDVPTLTPTRVEVPEDSSGPAQSFTYTWLNLRIYNTPQIPGTQFVADLLYTENGCIAEYQVKGIWPVVNCGSGTPKVPNDTLCDPNPDFETGRLRGSGINPLFPVKCDPVALICVLTGEVPSAPNP